MVVGASAFSLSAAASLAAALCGRFSPEASTAIVPAFLPCCFHGGGGRFSWRNQATFSGQEREEIVRGKRSQSERGHGKRNTTQAKKKLWRDEYPRLPGALIFSLGETHFRQFFFWSPYYLILVTNSLYVSPTHPSHFSGRNSEVTFPQQNDSGSFRFYPPPIDPDSGLGEGGSD